MADEAVPYTTLGKVEGWQQFTEGPEEGKDPAEA